MNKFSLELESWGEWELEKDFSDFQKAKAYALERFPQNNWRVFDRTAGSIVYQHEPFQTIATEASQELERFKTTDFWRAKMPEIKQRQRERERQDEERRVRQAEQHRIWIEQQHRIQEEQERRRREQQQQQRRGRGFHFVAETPDELDRIFNNDQRVPQPRVNFWEDEDDECVVAEKVNWLQEGF